MKHAQEAAQDEEESGWVEFEMHRQGNPDKESLIGLAMAAEKAEHNKLAAAIMHHIGLMALASSNIEEAGTFADRSMRLRESVNDSNGMAYGHALLSHVAKAKEDWDAAEMHCHKRMELVGDDDQARLETMQDIAHIKATTGELEQALAMMQESLDLAEKIGDLDGIIVARWGLADLAEISNQPDEAMVQLSGAMTSLMEAGIPVPDLLKQRIEKLTI
jgi:ATP/maltotriose-dependent transcriptional regulator MalT